MRTILLLAFGLLYGVGASQTTDSLSVWLQGDWVMKKHMVTESGKAVNKLTADVHISYAFAADGTYRTRAWDKSYDDAVVTIGRWKISANGKGIDIFQSRFLPPHDQDGNVADHPLELLELNNERLVIKEYIFSEDRPGTSTYERK